MDIKDTIGNVATSISTAVEHVVENVKDTISEIGHRTQAEAEHEKRDVAGDSMPLSEQAGSVFNEVKHETLAEVDAAKRNLRNEA